MKNTNNTQEETTAFTVLTLPVTTASGEKSEAFMVLNPLLKKTGLLADVVAEGLVDTFKAAHKAEEVYLRHHKMVYPSLTEEDKKVWMFALNEADTETLAAYWAIGSYLLTQWEEAEGVTVPKQHRSIAISIVADAALPLLGLKYGEQYDEWRD